MHVVGNYKYLGMEIENRGSWEVFRERMPKKAKQQQGVYAETTSTYRIFSRAFCNFVFPNEIVQDGLTSDLRLVYTGILPFQVIIQTFFFFEACV